MVEAGPGELGIVGRTAVAMKDRGDEGEIGGEGRDGGVDDRVVAERSPGLQPQPLVVAGAIIGCRGDEAHVESVGGRIAGGGEPVVVQDRRRPRERFRRRDDRTRVLVDEALLIAVERALEVEDRFAVLDRDDAASRERSAVAYPVDVVEDRNRRVTGPEEVRVQRMDASVLDRPSGGDERLSGHLTTEDADPALVDVAPAEDVHFDRLEVEEREQLGDR
jgi:hypothetical protein